MWACSGTTSFWKGSWAVINWKCPPFFATMHSCTASKNCMAISWLYILLIDYGRQVYYWKIPENILPCMRQEDVEPLGISGKMISLLQPAPATGVIVLASCVSECVSVCLCVSLSEANEQMYSLEFLYVSHVEGYLGQGQGNRSKGQGHQVKNIFSMRFHSNSEEARKWLRKQMRQMKPAFLHQAYLELVHIQLHIYECWG